MNDVSPINLIERGVRQGTYFTCKHISTELIEVVKENRSIKDHREKQINENFLLITLSQDCDITNTSEKYLEIIPAKKCKKKEITQKIQKTRNLRKLQLLIEDEYWICDVNLISQIPKTLFHEHLPAIEGQLNSQSKEILLQWRINRYTREPLPGKFNEAFLIGYVWQEETGFAQFLEKNKHDIIDLYAFVNPDEDDADEYLVSITALLAITCSNEKTKEIWDELFKHLTELHSRANGLKMIQIDDSYIPTNHQSTLDIATGPEDFSILDTYLMKRLTLDYLCWEDGKD